MTIGTYKGVKSFDTFLTQLETYVTELQWRKPWIEIGLTYLNDVRPTSPVVTTMNCHI